MYICMHVCVYIYIYTYTHINSYDLGARACGCLPEQDELVLCHRDICVCVYIYIYIYM